MFNRPRCRDWSPLATQQLRLRNLIGITGQSIVCSIKSQLYFTLHLTAMSAPFYTSEKIDSHGSGHVDWPEINCPTILKSTARSVCIRIWEHIPQTELQLHKERESVSPSTSSGSAEMQSSTVIDNDLSIQTQQQRRQQTTLSSTSNDKMLFIWGVYFSGLILLTKRTEVKFRPNSLIFQMHGGYFASAESLTQDSMRQQLKLTYQLDQEIISGSGGSKDSPPIRSTSRSLTATRNCDEISLRAATKSCDIFSNTSSNNIKSRLMAKKTTIPTTNDSDFQINSPRSSRSCSPVRNENFSCPSSIDLRRDLLGMLKIRYIDKKFLKSEIRPSYSLDKLLQLQEMQRNFKREMEDAKEIIEKICMKSAFCLNLELISSNKGLFNRQRSHPSMGKTLNRLLYQIEPQIKPEDLLRAQDLKRKIETARFRCRLLQEQRNRAKISIRLLEKKLCDLHDSNIDQESYLMSGYRNLSKEKDMLSQEKKLVDEKKDSLTRIRKLLKQRRRQLCFELKEIYPIEKKKNDCYMITNIYLPNADKLTNDSKQLNTDCVSEPVSPLSLSVAFGYVAHVVQMCSIILNLPLRNPIKHEGSRSKIFDIIKDIPIASREFPLYNRSNPPSKHFLYGAFLLNQNIVQLNFQVCGIKCDLRTTLPNLLQLLDGSNNKFSIHRQNPENSSKELLQDDNLSSLCDLENEQKNSTGIMTTMATGTNTAASISSSSNDLNVPFPALLMNISAPVDVVDMKHNDQRISRSVGSYLDEHLSLSSPSSSPTVSAKQQFHNSEPILTNIHNKIHLTSFNENGNV